MANVTAMPKNIGIIMDGNGRWAMEKGLPRTDGHTKGIANMLTLAAHAFSLGAESFVCYSLSTENLKREKAELEHILSLVVEYNDRFIEMCRKIRISVKYVGRLDLLPENIRLMLKSTESALSEFSSEGKTLYIAIAYGSRAEIVSAVNEAIRDGMELDEESFLKLLDYPESLDLIIRTGGERRLSNFFLYQASYAELYFSDKYFPDFSCDDLSDAVEWFSMRKRRYGLVK